MAGTVARDETLWLRANALARKHGRSEVFVRTSPVGKVKAFIAELDGAKATPVKKSTVVKKKTPVKKTAVKRTQPVKRGPGRPRKAETVEAPKRRGRPPGSKNKPKTAATKTATKRAPAKRTTAKRRAASQPARKAPVRKAHSNSDMPGRSVVRNRLKWSAQGYSPREGTIADEVFQVVKSVKGDRDEAFKILRKRIRTLFSGYEKEKAEQMLRYRISRVIWDFAQATGQHEKSANRAEYGTAGTGEGVYERGIAGNRGRPPINGKPKRKATATTAKRGRGRPKGSTNRTSARKAPARRKRTTAKR